MNATRLCFFCKLSLKLAEHGLMVLLLLLAWVDNPGAYVGLAR